MAFALTGHSGGGVPSCKALTGSRLQKRDPRSTFVWGRRLTPGWAPMVARARRGPDLSWEVSTMTRHVAIVAFALALGPSWLSAQGKEFTVNAVSADVHNFPSTGSPIIGHAARGTTLEVTRELGSW